MFQTMILSLNQKKKKKEGVAISAYVDNNSIIRYGKVNRYQYTYFWQNSIILYHFINWSFYFKIINIVYVFGENYLYWLLYSIFNVFFSWNSDREVLKIFPIIGSYSYFHSKYLYIKIMHLESFSLKAMTRNKIRMSTVMIYLRLLIVWVF